MFRKPPTRLEALQESVSETLDTLQHKIEPSLDKLRDVREHAGEVANSTLESAAQRAAVALHAAGETASGAVKTVPHIASHGVEVLGEKAHDLAGSAQNVAGSAAQTFGVVANRASSKAGEAAAAAQENASELRAQAAAKAARLAQIAHLRRNEAEIAQENAAQTLASTREGAKTHAAGLGALFTRPAAHEKKAAEEIAHEKAEEARREAAELLARTQNEVPEGANRATSFLFQKRDKVRDAQSKLEKAENDARKARDEMEKARSKAEKAAFAEQKKNEEAAEAAAKLLAQSEKQDKKAAKIARKKAAAASAALASSLASTRARSDEKRAELAQVRVEEKPSILLWLLAGVAIGAVFALLLAPSSGRRTRAALRDKVGKAKRDLTETASDTLKSAKTSVSGAYTGTVNDMTSDLETTGETLDDGDDATIADRVRTALGESELTRGHERLNVDSCQGVVTLRGPLPAESRSALETLVRTVKGVRDVNLETVSESDEEVFVG